MFEELIARWGYLAVGLGTFIEGETVLLAAGALARKGLLALPSLLVCAIAGSVTWSQLWFHTGRRLGRFAVDRRPTWQVRASQIERLTTRHGRLFVIAYRFVAGMGAVCPALLGASGYSPRRFAWLDSLGAGAWAAAFTGIGWGLAAGL